jgi:hypothetical protein
MFTFNWTDITVILAYFIATIGIELAVIKRVSKSMDNHFLGGNALPHPNSMYETASH